MERTTTVDSPQTEPLVQPDISVGELLRSRREALGMSLKEIAATTKIQQSNLRALEENRFQELPAEVFTRGFLRSFSRELGLDEDAVIDAYLAQTGTAQALVPTPTEAAPPAAREGATAEELVAPDQTARVLYVAALAVMIVGLALAVLMLSGGDSAPSTAATWQPAEVEDNWRPAPAGHLDWQSVREN